jgi:gluconolactonase
MNKGKNTMAQVDESTGPAEFKVIATGLRFPEGPIAMDDGSVILVEIERQTLTRVKPDGSTEIIAELGGGPNGAAIGPDGRCYVCNDGGFQWMEEDGILVPHGIPDDYSGGRIEAVNLESGEFEVLYSECNGIPLNGPNDIVFDKNGGFWFSDLGKMRDRSRDMGGVYYAKTDGSMIKEAVFGLDGPNGVGLSADEKTIFVAQTFPGSLISFDITGEGELAETEGWLPGNLVYGLPNGQLLDSLALDANGNVCVATLINPGGITTFQADGSAVDFVELPDLFTTNICFGGPNLKTAYITLSGTGQLISMDWPVAGLPLNFLNK